jgi:hypothetical protein
VGVKNTYYLYSVHVDFAKYNLEMFDWLKDNVGAKEDYWYGWATTTPRLIEVGFRYEKDAALFALRWV